VTDDPECEVRLARTDPSLTVSCSCNQADDSQVCRHLWAAILQAELEGYFRGFEPEYAAASAPTPEARTPQPDAFPRAKPPRQRQPERPPLPPRPPKPKPPAWQESLAGLRKKMQQEETPSRSITPATRVLYVVDVHATREAEQLVVETLSQQPKKAGGWTVPRNLRLDCSQVGGFPDPADRQALAMLTGARAPANYGYYGYYDYYNAGTSRFQVPRPLQEAVAPVVCRTGRCRLRLKANDPDLVEVAWDEGGPWGFWLAVVPEPGVGYRLHGELRRGEERMELSAPALMVPGGLVFWDGKAAPLDDAGAFDWIGVLGKKRNLSVPAEHGEQLLEELLRLPRLPRLDLPEGLRYQEVSPTPRPRLVVRAPAPGKRDQKPRLRGELSFDYEGQVVEAGQAGRTVYQPARRRLIVRDPAAELSAAARLEQVGFRARQVYDRGKPTRQLELTPRNLPKVVRTLVQEGWAVEAEGKLYRHPGAIQVAVNSGVDWFELHGSVEFGDQVVHLPDLLAALRRGENTVRLGDGTFGMVPEEWLRKFGPLAGLGAVEEDHLRFRRTQAGLLDALLAAQPEASYDEVFARARDELRSFAGVEPADPTGGFQGTLRAYQRDGLGWLHFLRRFHFGGCLADDMGLGKTVQVLALLEERRVARAEAGGDAPPSLVVVPRSLIFNWKEEAARFTPRLRVFDQTGPDRARDAGGFGEADVVLTTYGTLRRDVQFLKDFRFDYCILDEAQAIKNADSESAKAARLLQGGHRLALSGTPVENHLGELWSLFEFLNPGMLGSASVFQLVQGRNPDDEARQLLAKALRPFILRRTKEQVAQDLPEKTEQTIYCELEGEQKRRYDELRDYYRRALLGQIDEVGLNRSKMQILEALLRLRQAACHPGLIDPDRTSEPSAKLDALLPQLAELMDEGHKVLVFSQFTKLLAIVRKRLDDDGLSYEYLDGRTRDRQARVERFQEDPECKLFLISLKAGGLGLNLTAAEYVFLLDPWWNPAVEAQAIDRAHRIGQTRPVFAYRLIARDTVEEKILELQKSKRDLADAIINADNSLIRTLDREDLELLLS
jgi:superfamily II DNA or RNA helicase